MTAEEATDVNEIGTAVPPNGHGALDLRADFQTRYLTLDEQEQDSQ